MVPEHEAYDTQRLPAKIWVGKRDGEWPLIAFESEGAAQRWQSEHDSRVRRVWELRTETAVERRVKVVPQETSWDA